MIVDNRYIVLTVFMPEPNILSISKLKIEYLEQMLCFVQTMYMTGSIN